MSESDESAALQRLMAAQRELKARLKARLSDNLKALQVYLPTLAAEFEARQPQLETRFCSTENGLPNFYLKAQDELLYNVANPRELARQQLHEQLRRPFTLPSFDLLPNELSQIQIRYFQEAVHLLEPAASHSLSPTSLEKLPLCVVLGVGLGYLLEALTAPDGPKVQRVVIVEPDDELLFASLYTFDWASVLRRAAGGEFELDLIRDQDPALAVDKIADVLSEQGTFLSCLTPCLMHYRSAPLRAVARELFKSMWQLMQHTGFCDDLLFGLSHGIKAALAGYRFVRRHARLPGQWAATPVFVIGSGPSLDKDIAFIRAHQHQALIVACGTAVDALYCAGVQPDLYCCTERDQAQAQLLSYIPDREFLRRMVCVGSEVLHPDTLSPFDKHALFIKAGEFCEKLFMFDGIFAQLAGTPQLATIGFMNPLVGNLGLAATLAFGFREIYLFGLDCGARSGGAASTDVPSADDTDEPQGSSHHTSLGGLYQLKDNLNRALTGNGYDDSDLAEPEGNFGGRVRSNTLLVRCRNTLEQALKAYPEARCCNCSDGLRIAGATPVHSAALNFTSRPPVDKAALRQTLAVSLTTPLNLNRGQLPMILAQIPLKEFTAALKQCFEPWPEDAASLVLTCVRFARLLHQSSSEPIQDLAVRLIRGTVETFFLLMVEALAARTDLKESLELARAIFARLCYCLEDFTRLFTLAPEYVMGAHLKLLNGHIGYDHEGSPAPPLGTPEPPLAKSDWERPPHFTLRTS